MTLQVVSTLPQRFGALAVPKHVVAVPAQDAPDALSARSAGVATSVVVIDRKSLGGTTDLAPATGHLPESDRGHSVSLRSLIVGLAQNLRRALELRAPRNGAGDHPRTDDRLSFPVTMGSAKVATVQDIVVTPREAAPMGVPTMLPNRPEVLPVSALAGVPIAQRALVPLKVLTSGKGARSPLGVSVRRGIVGSLPRSLFLSRTVRRAKSQSRGLDTDGAPIVRTLGSVGQEQTKRLTPPVLPVMVSAQAMPVGGASAGVEITGLVGSGFSSHAVSVSQREWSRQWRTT